jgi:hypothetical protein
MSLPPTRDPLAPAAAPPPSAEPRRWHERAIFWAPVWLPMAVLMQLAWLGLGPALAEQRRLERAERELARRLERETDEQAQLARWTRAQNDPIYLERERRRLRAEGAEPTDSDAAQK